MYPFSIFEGITIVIREQLNGNKTLKIQKKNRENYIVNGHQDLCKNALVKERLRSTPSKSPLYTTRKWVICKI